MLNGAIHQINHHPATKHTVNPLLSLPSQISSLSLISPPRFHWMVTPLTINYKKYVKGLLCVNRDRRYTKRVSFVAKMVYKTVRGLVLRAEPSRIECARDQGYEKKFHLLFCKIEKCKLNILGWYWRGKNFFSRNRWFLKVVGQPNQWNCCFLGVFSSLLAQRLGQKNTVQG